MYFSTRLEYKSFADTREFQSEIEKENSDVLIFFSLDLVLIKISVFDMKDWNLKMLF